MKNSNDLGKGIGTAVLVAATNLATPTSAYTPPVSIDIATESSDIRDTVSQLLKKGESKNISLNGDSEGISLNNQSFSLGLDFIKKSSILKAEYKNISGKYGTLVTLGLGEDVRYILLTGVYNGTNFSSKTTLGTSNIDGYKQSFVGAELGLKIKDALISVYGNGTNTDGSRNLSVSVSEKKVDGGKKVITNTKTSEGYNTNEIGGKVDFLINPNNKFSLHAGRKNIDGKYVRTGGINYSNLSNDQKVLTHIYFENNNNSKTLGAKVSYMLDNGTEIFANGGQTRHNRKEDNFVGLGVNIPFGNSNSSFSSFKSQDLSNSIFYHIPGAESSMVYENIKTVENENVKTVLDDKKTGKGTSVTTGEKPKAEFQNGSGVTADEKPNYNLEEKEIIENVDIDFDIEYKEDPNLPKGETRIEDGKNGKKKITKKQYIGENGEVLKEDIILEEIIEDPKNKIVYTGTKEIKNGPGVTAGEKPNYNLEEKEIIEKVDIDFDIEYKEDPNLPKGKTRTEDGKNGKKKITKKQYIGENGEVLKEEIISEEIIEAPKNKIVYTGTKEIFKPKATIEGQEVEIIEGGQTVIRIGGIWNYDNPPKISLPDGYSQNGKISRTDEGGDYFSYAIDFPSFSKFAIIKVYVDEITYN